MEQIKVISDFQKSKTLCPQCQGTNCIKRGKRRDKQRYQCKDCYRGFTENILTNPGKHIPAKYILPQNISAYEMKEYDTWDLRILGKNLKKIISGMEKHQTMRGLGHNEWEEKE